MSGWYRRIWRWHFYAGLIALPVIALLALSGMIYLFKPSIDDWSERAYDHLALAGPAHSLDDQVAAAGAAFPAARVKALEWRADPADAARVLMIGGEGAPLRVLVRPDTLAILAAGPERNRPSEIIKHLHRDLLSGDTGAILVEAASGWGVVLFLTGLYLWWPRGAVTLAGVLYPRRRRLLRDLHAVTGFWISMTALFLLLSPLPMTKVWGGAFKQMRVHAEGRPSHMHEPAGIPAGLVHGFDRAAALVPGLGLAEPVLISPGLANWTISSNSRNRLERTSVEIDPEGAVIRKSGFADKSPVDRVIGVAISAHEGRLFGWANLALGLLTCCALLTMSVSALLLWWKRRPADKLGAPPPAWEKAGLGLAVLVMMLGVVLPTVGISLMLILVLERLVLGRIPAARRFLGLEGPNAQAN